MPRVVPGSKRDQLDERAESVFNHRRAGGRLNRAFAKKLAADGFTDPHGFPLELSVLRRDYARYVEHQQIFHRDTYESFGTMQMLRLERNIEILDKYFEAFNIDIEDPNLDANGFPLVPPGLIFSVTSLAKEIRQSIAEISKLVGANAPTEVIVTQRLENEVQSILAILRQGLSDEIFQEVAQCLAKGMGLARERAQVVDDGMQLPQGYAMVEGEGDGRES